MRLDFCVACGAKKGLHHHHLVPKSILPDPDRDPKRVITLCPKCHASIHEKRSDKGIRANHGELIKMGQERRRKEGRHVGSPPYGFDKVDGKLVPNGMEQKVIKDIQGMRRRGIGWTEIASWLNEEEVPTKKGGSYIWSRCNLRNMINAIDDGKWEKYL